MKFKINIEPATVLAGGAMIVGLLALSIMLLRPSPKVVYIRTQQVFQEFVMTKELQAKLHNKQQARATVLKEYEIMINAYKANPTLSKVQQDTLRQLQEALQIKKAELTADHDADIEAYDQQIWTQLNQYIQDYGRNVGSVIILGADGSGLLMYAPESSDETDRVIKFVNQKYQGK